MEVTVKVLVTGWFSFEHGEATAGDLMARDVACGWLERAGRSYEVALSPAFGGGVDCWSVDPAAYSEVVFVCGPARGGQIERLRRRFAGCRFVGLDVSITAASDDRFGALIERDGPATARPDISFLARTEAMRVAGLVLAHPQPEYGDRARQGEVHAAILRALHARRLCVVPFDTRVDPRRESFPGAFRTSDEVEALVARLDLVVTTRMHGLVHALKNGVPAVAVDPISGGAKVSAQAEAVGWPAIVTADELSGAALEEALDFCLTQEAQRAARDCAGRAEALLLRARDAFVSELRDGGR